MRTIDNSVFIAPGAQVIGDVTIGEKCGNWYNRHWNLKEKHHDRI